MSGAEAETPRDRVGRETHVNVLVGANRFLGAVEELCREEGVSHAQYIALWVLCLSPDAEAGLPLRALADGLLNRASDASRLVDRMEAAGLAERLPNPADRRGVLVRATGAGRAVVARLAPRLRIFHREQWAALSDQELDALHALLAKALWPSK